MKNSCRKKKNKHSFHHNILIALTVIIFIAVALVMALRIISRESSRGNYEASDNKEYTGETDEREYTLNNFYFDTVVSIKFYANDDGDELVSGCNEICIAMQETFSRTDENSELYKLNHRTDDVIDVSEDLAELIRVGLDYYQISGGKFDITVAPLSDLWDFKSEDAKVPDEEKIREAAAKVDATKLHVNGTTVSFDSPDTMIDLGALVKGYVADKIASYLKEAGVSSGLINLGGNVLAIGAKQDGSAWRIGIQKPFDTGIIDTVEVMDKAVVSSGIYERYFEQDGIIYHHILDPDTGYPVEDGLWGVTIICGSSLLGDALSTTCLVDGQEEASKLISSLSGVEAVFVDDNLDETKVFGKQEES